MHSQSNPLKPVQLIKLSRSNCYLIQGKKSILVDTGNEGEMNLIERQLNSHHTSLSNISLLFHTHGHGDHCGSTVEIINKFPHLKTAIHKLDNPMCMAGVSDPIQNTRLLSKILKPFVSKPFPKFSNDFLISKPSDFSLLDFGIDGEIISTPGHTNGSISIVLQNGTAIIGDVLMGGYFGGKFAPSLPDFHYYVTNRAQVIESIEKLLSLDIHTFYVGHGGPLTRTAIINWFYKQKIRP